MLLFKKIILGVLVLLCVASACGCAVEDASGSLANVTKITVPNFVGMSYEDILSNETYNTYNITVEYQFSNSVAYGKVISQSEIAGEKVGRGKQIILTVSKGPETVTLPPITGLNSQDAKAHLIRLGIAFQEKLQASTTIPKGVVITTSPSVGAEIPNGTVVDIYVSSGPDVTYCTVSDYTKLSETAARELIEKDGFTVENVYYEDSLEPEGYVIRQSLTVGTQREKGTGIDIYVSTGVPSYEYTLVIKDQLLSLIFDDEHKDMTLSLIIDGTVVTTTERFDVNIRQGEFEFKIKSQHPTLNATIRMNFENGDKANAFDCEIDMHKKTANISKNNDLFDYVIGVE